MELKQGMTKEGRIRVAQAREAARKFSEDITATSPTHEGVDHIHAGLQSGDPERVAQARAQI